MRSKIVHNFPVFFVLLAWVDLKVPLIWGMHTCRERAAPVMPVRGENCLQCAAARACAPMRRAGCSFALSNVVFTTM